MALVAAIAAWIGLDINHSVHAYEFNAKCDALGWTTLRGYDDGKDAMGCFKVQELEVK
jgi:hypothetical protein